MRILILTLVLIFLSCTDPSSSEKFLQATGCKDIEFTGYSFFSCSDDDWYHTDFKAICNNKKVEGTVCGGLFFKGYTVRFK